MSPRRKTVEVTGLNHKGHSFVHRPRQTLGGNQLALALAGMPLKAAPTKLMKMGGALLVTGSRHWESPEDIELQFAMLMPEIVIHGDCEGADELAGACARVANIDIMTFPVNEKLDGHWPAAGVRRNARMVRDSNPTQGLALGALWKRALAPRRGSGGLIRDVETDHAKHTGTGITVDLMLKQGLVVRWIKQPGAAHVDLVEMPEWNADE